MSSLTNFDLAATWFYTAKSQSAPKATGRPAYHPSVLLLKLARNLRDELEGLPGVLEAEIAGDRDEVLEIVVDPLRLESYNISYGQLLDSVSRNNQLIAAGALDTGQGKFSVKVPGLFKTLEDILSLPVKVEDDAVVTVADITTVRRTFKDARAYARFDGRAAIALEIKKRLGENVIDTIEDVRRITELESNEWPEAVKVSFIRSKSRSDSRISPCRSETCSPTCRTTSWPQSSS